MPRQDETPLRIVTTACDQMEQAGAQGLRVDAVARDAGVNKRMIYHYFGDRAGLIKVCSAFCLHHLSALPECDEQTFQWVSEALSVEDDDANRAARLSETRQSMPRASAIDIAAASTIVLAQLLHRNEADWPTEVPPRQFNRFLQHLLTLSVPVLKQKPSYRLRSDSRASDR